MLSNLPRPGANVLGAVLMKPQNSMVSPTSHPRSCACVIEYRPRLCRRVSIHQADRRPIMRCQKGRRCGFEFHDLRRHGGMVWHGFERRPGFWLPVEKDLSLAELKVKADPAKDDPGLSPAKSRRGRAPTEISSPSSGPTRYPGAPGAPTSDPGKVVQVRLPRGHAEIGVYPAPPALKRLRRRFWER